MEAGRYGALALVWLLSLGAAVDRTALAADYAVTEDPGLPQPSAEQISKADELGDEVWDDLTSSGTQSPQGSPVPASYQSAQLDDPVSFARTGTPVAGFFGPVLPYGNAATLLAPLSFLRTVGTSVCRHSLIPPPQLGLSVFSHLHHGHPHHPHKFAPFRLRGFRGHQR